MDNWLWERYQRDARAMRNAARDWWWTGWTMVIIGMMPVVLGVAFARMPPDSHLAGLAQAIPGWVVLAGGALMYVGLILAVVGWYLRSLSKRQQQYF